MNKKELIKNITSDIQDIYSVTNRFEHSEKIHPLDLDLALSKVRNLYDLLLKLEPGSRQSAEIQREEISTTVKKEEQKSETEITKEPITKPADPETKPTKEDKEVMEEKKEQEKDHEPEFVIESGSKEENSDNRGTEDDNQSSKTNPEIIADKFHSKKFVHDSFSKKNLKNDVSSKMQSKPISDINTAIGLNDKFIFIRELFGNNKEHYHETIQLLNNFDTFENAVAFLDDNFDWDEDDANYLRLKELVRRKYATN